MGVGRVGRLTGMEWRSNLFSYTVDFNYANIPINMELGAGAR